VARLLEYIDPVEGCPGFLVYDSEQSRLAAGGCRMDADLTAGTLRSLAARMTLKQRVLGLNVDGAKCGIAYHPQGPGRAAVLRRFIEFLRAELGSRFSMGCDMGTSFAELEGIARELGIGSVKIAIRSAQQIADDSFHRRMRLLDAPVGLLTLGECRAGYALAQAAIAVIRQSGPRLSQATVTMQGFGNLGRGAAMVLREEGIRVVAVADEYGCMVDPGGLDLGRMLSVKGRRPVPTLLGGPMSLSADALFDLPADVLILAASQDALSPQQAAVLPVPAVVVGANNGLSATAEQLLADRGVLVVPDFIGGIGGSASMEALFGPSADPAPEDVLATMTTMMSELINDMLTGSRDRGLTMSQVAHDIAASAPTDPSARPYGASRYLVTGRAPHGNRAAASATHPAQGIL
jgi:glutamate dehydrogenase (NAD(P)+)